MDNHAISQQVLVEHDILSHITGALRATIGWKYQAADLTRKLESLRFVSQSLQRHLKHLLELEEEDGYMSVILETKPELSDKVEALRLEHGDFRKTLRRLLVRLNAVQPTDHLGFAKISEDLLALLDQLDEHSKKETDLIQQGLLEDEGGEG